MNSTEGVILCPVGYTCTPILNETNKAIIIGLLSWAGGIFMTGCGMYARKLHKSRNNETVYERKPIPEFRLSTLREDPREDPANPV